MALKVNDFGVIRPAHKATLVEKADLPNGDWNIIKYSIEFENYEDGQNVQVLGARLTWRTGSCEAMFKIDALARCDIWPGKLGNLIPVETDEKSFNDRKKYEEWPAFDFDELLEDCKGTRLALRHTDCASGVVYRNYAYLTANHIYFDEVIMEGDDIVSEIWAITSPIKFIPKKGLVPLYT